jgi:dUTP pyrophosphatase
MKIKIMLDEGKGIMPSRAHETDAGLDLYTPKKVIVPGCRGIVSTFLTDIRIGYATIDTGIHIEIPRGYTGFIKSKSGLAVKHGLTAAGGVIDSGYTGAVVVKLFNHTEKDYVFEAGDKIAQLVLLPIITPELEEVDSLEDTERGNGGFGSTGR